jgi:hypothetical protein
MTLLVAVQPRHTDAATCFESVRHPYTSDSLFCGGEEPYPPRWTTARAPTSRDRYPRMPLSDAARSDSNGQVLQPDNRTSNDGFVPARSAKA